MLSILSRGIVALPGFVFLVGLFLVDHGDGQAFAQSAPLQQKALQASDMLAKARDTGTVRVIVTYGAQRDAAQTLGTERENLAAITAANKSAQDAIVASAIGAPASLSADKGYKGFSVTPGFAITVTAAELEALAADPRVSSISIDALSRPNLLQALPLIGMPTAVSLGATAAGQAVAVIDTGSDSTHKFLAGKLVAEACFSTNSGTYGMADGSMSLCPGAASSSTASGAGQPCNASVNGCEHGTHVAGIAVGNNTEPQSGQPTTGAGRSGSLIAIQVFSQFNSVSDCGSGAGASPCLSAYGSDIIAALNYVYSIRNSLPGGVKVAAANLSLGGGAYSSNCDASWGPTKSAVDLLRGAGIATLAAAGNEYETSRISFPACISTAVAIAASEKDGDAIASYSNISNQVAFFAPGGDFYPYGSSTLDLTKPILSSVPSGFNPASFGFSCEYSGPAPSAGGSYCHLAGTSMATPMAAGVFAAIRSVCPAASIDTIVNAIVSTGTPITDDRNGGTITKPRVRADLALQLACAGSGTLAVSPGAATSFSGTAGGSFTPSSASYQLSASIGTLNFTVSGVPAWLTPSSTSGSVTASPTTLTFTLNAAANSLAAGTYNATITFTNSTNGQGSTTRDVSLTVTGRALAVAEAANIATTGNAGGPFAPASFIYTLSSSGSGDSYTVSGVPPWLSASSTAGSLSGPTPITFTPNAAAGSLPVGTQTATITFANADGANVTRTATIVVNGTPGAGGTSLVAAILPTARTTTVGTPVTAFATLVNAGSSAASGCFIAPPASLPGTFLYQTTNAANLPVGTPNTPVDIPVGGAQTFYFAITPAQTGSFDLGLIFGCSNASAPVSVSGLNTFVLSVGATPVADVVSISNTLSGDGNIVVTGASGRGVMVVAGINVGEAGTVTFRASDTPFGAAARGVPVTLTICPTDSAAVCTAPEASSYTTSVAKNQILTFNIYVQGQGTLVPYDPATTRVFMIAEQGGTAVGATSAALWMKPAVDTAALKAGAVQ